MPDNIKRGGDDKSREPVLSAPASQPVGTGVGPTERATAGTTADAAGALDPLEAAAREGRLASGGSHEAFDPTTEDDYWRENYAQRPYVKGDRGYEHYQPAYRYGWELRQTNAGRNWEEMEPDLARGWEDNLASSQVAWHEPKLAARDAWERLDRQHPGESNRVPQ